MAIVSRLLSAATEDGDKPASVADETASVSHAPASRFDLDSGAADVQEDDEQPVLQRARRRRLRRLVEDDEDDERDGGAAETEVLRPASQTPEVRSPALPALIAVMQSMSDAALCATCAEELGVTKECMDCPDQLFCERCIQDFHQTNGFAFHRYIVSQQSDADNADDAKRRSTPPAPPARPVPPAPAPQAAAAGSARKRKADATQLDSKSASPAKKSKTELKSGAGRKLIELLEPIRRDPRSSANYGDGFRFVQQNITIRTLDVVTAADSPSQPLVLVDAYSSGAKKPKYHCRLYNAATGNFRTLAPTKLNPGTTGKADDATVAALTAALEAQIEKDSLRYLPQQCALLSALPSVHGDL